LVITSIPSPFSLEATRHHFLTNEGDPKATGLLIQPARELRREALGVDRHYNRYWLCLPESSCFIMIESGNSRNPTAAPLVRAIRQSGQVKRLREWLDGRGLREKSLKEKIGVAIETMQAMEKIRREQKKVEKEKADAGKKKGKKRGRRRQGSDDDEAYNSHEDEEEVERFEDALEADKAYEECVSDLKERLVAVERLLRGVGKGGVSGWAKAVREADKAELYSKACFSLPQRSASRDLLVQACRSFPLAGGPTNPSSFRWSDLKSR